MTKPIKCNVRPAKTQSSLGRSESLLGAHQVCWFCHEAAIIMEFHSHLFQKKKMYCNQRFQKTVSAAGIRTL